MGKAPLALKKHEVVLKSFDPREHDLGTIGNDLTPGFAAWVFDGGDHEAKRSPARVRANEENLFAGLGHEAGVVVGVILVIVLAGRN